MEENNLNSLQGETISLGGLTGAVPQPSQEIQAPVFVNNVVTPVDNLETTIITPNEEKLQVSSTVSVTEPEVNSVNTEVGENNKVEEVKSELSDKLIVKTKTLQAMLSRAKVIANPAAQGVNEQLTKIIQLTFSEEGLLITVSDGRNYYKELNQEVKFTQDLSVGISSELFPALVNKLICENVELTYDSEKRNIILKCDDGVYIFQEQYDIGTGEAANIQFPEEYKDIRLESINLADFASRIGRSAPLMSNGEANNTSSGAYCAEQDIYQTNGNVVSITENIPDFKTRKFFLTTTNVNILAGLNINGDCNIGFLYDEAGMITNIAFVKNNMELLLMTKDADDFNDFPFEALSYWKDHNMENSTIIKKARLTNMLEKATLFCHLGALPENVEFSCVKNILRISVNDGMMDEKIILPQELNEFNPYYVNIDDLFKGVKALPDEDIVVGVGTSNDSVIELKGKAQKVIVLRTTM